MNVVSVSKLLARQDHGLNAPTLNVLVADASNYSVHLLQPQARMEATQAEIRNRDGNLATAQFGDFLEKAFASGADLLVTPEYSTPWNVLRDAINGVDKGPAPGKLWVLGCESIKYSELQRFRDEISEHATVIFEEMNPNDGRFVDPLTYVFSTTENRDDERLKLVVLVQFKTHPMADDHDFERNLLQLGSDVYQFGSYGAWVNFTTRDKRYQSPEAISQLTDDTDSTAQTQGFKNPGDGSGLIPQGGNRTIVVTNNAKATETDDAAAVYNTPRNWGNTTVINADIIFADGQLQRTGTVTLQDGSRVSVQA
ncbi:hypothetical protein LCGC14_3096100, partial [marine sediment metagenome]